MASGSLNDWRRVRVLELDQMENVLHLVGGVVRGRRYATVQINHAYTMLLSSHFQGYCRDLHSECVNHLVSRIEIPGVAPRDLQDLLQVEFLLRRKLDSGNPHPGALGEDFNRFGLNFWDKVKALDPSNTRRIALLTELNSWRNAIAHQNFDSLSPPGTASSLPPYLRLDKVRSWRAACEHFTVDFDVVMSTHLGLLIGSPPW